MPKLSYEFVRDFIFQKGFFLLSDTYDGSEEKLILKDNDGYLYYTSYGKIRYSNPAKFFNKNPYTEQNINLWIKINNRPFKLLEGQSFYSSKNKLFFKCYICAEDEIPFSLEWSYVIGGRGCGICHSKQIGKYNNLEYKFPEIAKMWDYEKNGSIFPKDVFPYSRDFAWWICETCGKEFRQKICDRINNHVTCEVCARKKWINSKRTNVMNSGRDITITNPEIISDWDYENNLFPPNAYTAGANESVYWKCSVCDNSWSAPVSRRTGFYKSGCPACSSSRGEKQISAFLYKNSIEFETQKIFSDCRWNKKGFLRFDFYIKNKNLVIEYDGIQHFEPIMFGGISKEESEINLENQKAKDRIKDEYCKKNNINFIRVPYWEYDNIEKILSSINDLTANHSGFAVFRCQDIPIS